MALRCLAGHHAAYPSNLRNQGLYFSSCRNCGRDMVRSRTKWRRVPSGFRVVWRPAEQVGHDIMPDAPAQAVGRPASVAPRPRRPFGLAELALSGLKLLVLHGWRRFGQWQRKLAFRSHERSPLIYLPAQ